MGIREQLLDEKGTIYTHFEKKKRIFDALDAIVGPDMPFHKVKISMLCEAAGISRTQFYTYFDSLNDVPNWHSLLAHEMGLDRVGISLNWRESYFLTSQEFFNHRSLYNSVALRQGADSPYNIIMRHRINQLRSNVKQKGGEITPLIDFQIESLSDLEFSTFTKWNQGKIDMPLRQFCAYQETLVPRELYKALETPLDVYL